MDPSKAYAEGEGLYGAIYAALPISFRVHLRAVGGQDFTSASSAVVNATLAPNDAYLYLGEGEEICDFYCSSTFISPVVNGVINVTYTPMSPIVYTLTISVDECPVFGSPFFPFFQIGMCYDAIICAI